MVRHPGIPPHSGKADFRLDTPVSEESVTTLFSNNQKTQNSLKLSGMMKPALGQRNVYTQWPT